MKKNALFLLLTLLFTLSLYSCFHKHAWEEASCFNPKTCIECGITEGNPLEHNWIEATCEEAKYCSVCGYQEGEKNGHTWVDATCFKPRYCSVCNKTQGKALEHRWLPATCETPKHCSYCATLQGTTIEHNWTKSTSNTPSICLMCNKMKPLALPKSGQVFIGSNLYRHSKLSIKSSTTSSCYIKLKSTVGKDVFSFFVRAGESVTVSVPSDNFYVYFAYGSEWYGTEHIFGPSTTYSKDDEILNFKDYSWEYTLYPVTNGNFSETPIDAEEFK